MFRHLVRFSLPLVLAGAAVFLVMLVLVPPAARLGGALTREGDASAAALPFTIALVPVVTTDLAQPVHLTHAGDGSGRLFVVERAGRIRVIKNGVLLPTPYLDISSLVQSGFVEQGLLSVAFDPDFKTNGTFYVDYTDKTGVGNTAAVRYVISNPASDVANPITVTRILTVVQPEVNHNGGQLQFGPNDGHLYIGMGDGGGGGDQHGTIGNGQDLGVLLGKLLRLNVRGVPTYTIPPTNPFTRTAGARPEVWAYGLRNPWRFSFDRANGDLYVGDVGQDCFEEIDYQPASSHGGENFGWRLMEGFHRFDPSNPSNCAQPIVNPVTLTLPITEYVHPIGDAVVSGYVYRGSQYPQMQGVYFYGDAGTGRIWTMQQIAPGIWVSEQKLDTSLSISSFGEDESGELYVVDLNGGVYRITSSSPAIPPDFSGTTKRAMTGSARVGDVVTYIILLANSGGPVTSTVRVTDTISSGLDYVPGSFKATGGITSVTLPTLTWQSEPSTTFPITLMYAVTVSSVSTLTIQNVATIYPGVGAPFERSAVIIVNPYQVYLPLVTRSFP